MCNKLLWHNRAERVRFLVWKGKQTKDMTEEEVMRAFDGLSKEFGIHYIWGGCT